MSKQNPVATATQADELAPGLARALELIAEAAPRAGRPVAPRAPIQEVRGQLRDTIPEHGVGVLAALGDFAERILPHCMGNRSPRYLGLINSTPLPAAVIGDLLVSALNNNTGTWEQSPAAAAAEEELVRWFAALVGLPAQTSGIILPGGTYATLHGLLLARARHQPDWDSAGPGALTAAPRIYTSDASHFSVARAARIIGLGAGGVVALPGRGRGTLDPRLLEQRIARDRARGHAPMAVVATAGTTGTGAIDPLDAIAEVCRRHRLWLHVDACYGGGALLLPELRPRLAGIARCDSISIDPHKWFFMPLCAALCLTPHRQLERQAFAVHGASYIPAAHHTVDAFHRGVPTSRRASALTLWLALRAHGWHTIARAVRRNIALARALERALAARGFTVLPGGALSTVCARWQPPGLDAASADALQGRIARQVVDTGDFWFATVEHAGHTWLRFNVVNLYTGAGDIASLAERLSEVAMTVAPAPVAPPHTPWISPQNPVVP